VHDPHLWGPLMNRRPSLPELVEMIDHATRAVGEAQALEILGVHRTTLMRWRTGKVGVPHAALALLRIWHSGRLPGMSDDWRGFHFFGDRLYTDAGIGYSARDINGWHWKEQNCAAQSRRVEQLEAIVRDLADKLQAAHGAAANEGYLHPGNPPPKPRRMA
jgi:hypothetical protein